MVLITNFAGACHVGVGAAPREATAERSPPIGKTCFKFVSKLTDDEPLAAVDMPTSTGGAQCWPAGAVPPLVHDIF
jgi:hypothetical protein